MNSIESIEQHTHIEGLNICLNRYKQARAHAHTHTHIYIYIHVYKMNYSSLGIIESVGIWPNAKHPGRFNLEHTYFVTRNIPVQNNDKY